MNILNEYKSNGKDYFEIANKRNIPTFLRYIELLFAMKSLHCKNQPITVDAVQELTQLLQNKVTLEQNTNICNYIYVLFHCQKINTSVYSSWVAVITLFFSVC